MGLWPVFSSTQAKSRNLEKKQGASWSPQLFTLTQHIEANKPGN